MLSLFQPQVLNELFQNLRPASIFRHLCFVTSFIRLLLLLTNQTMVIKIQYHNHQRFINNLQLLQSHFWFATPEATPPIQTFNYSFLYSISTNEKFDLRFPSRIKEKQTEIPSKFPLSIWFFPQCVVLPS